MERRSLYASAGGSTHHDTHRRLAGGTIRDLDGPTIGPADPGYDTAKSVYNAMIDKSPALIAQVRTVDDVVRSVNAAREQGVLVVAVMVVA